jgi:uncharacterized protein YjbI with pentapeptide repeats
MNRLRERYLEHRMISGSIPEVLVAVKEHVALLKQDVGAWNAWRNQNPDVRPNLFGADLGGLNLREANLSETILNKADLTGADAWRT